MTWPNTFTTLPSTFTNWPKLVSFVAFVAFAPLPLFYSSLLLCLAPLPLMLLICLSFTLCCSSTYLLCFFTAHLPSLPYCSFILQLNMIFSFVLNDNSGDAPLPSMIIFPTFSPFGIDGDTSSTFYSEKSLSSSSTISHFLPFWHQWKRVTPFSSVFSIIALLEFCISILHSVHIPG